MKAGGRVRFFVTLLSVLAGSAVVGLLVYQTTYESLRQAYQQMLDKSVDQGVFLVESYLKNQHTLLSLYASVPSVQQGQFPDLPEWLATSDGSGPGPKRLAIIDSRGRGRTNRGETFVVPDRSYFLEARAGRPSVSAPIVSRIDHQPIVVIAAPIPGGNLGAAVLTESIDPGAFRNLLDSIRILSGANLTLRASGLTLASVGDDLDPGEALSSLRTLGSVPWTIQARIGVADTIEPVRQVLLMVGILIVTGAGFIVVFFLTGLQHRLDLKQAQDDRTQALREAYEQIRKLAYHDTVTRLPNRNLVTRKVGEALQDGVPRRVFIVALARFRHLTTTFGLRFGDQILKETSTRLAAFAKAEGSFLGRLGGSEFILMVDENQSDTSAQDLVRAFAEPMGQENIKLHISVHVGTCTLAEGGQNAEEVIKSAETALWAARDKGPNEASELTKEAVQQRLRRAELQSLLPGALARGELEVYYQPQVELASGSVIGYEALMRWFSPELGAVQPSEFIPVAEETGAIVPLGYWVLEEGMAFAKALRAQGSEAVVSVNVSPVQFLHHGFLHEVERRVVAAQLPPQSLGLEITESTLIEGFEQLSPSLGRIMDMGVKISLDDFGTGYSSLNYLKELPLHVLKIDKSFIDALETDERALHLIASIIQLAHHLGLVVLAEGTETASQQDLLASLGCDLVQGFHTGRPQPSEDLLGVRV